MPCAWIVVNPIAGSPGRRQALDAFRATLAAEGFACDVRPTERAGHGRVIARDAAAADVDVLVAAGGDGTVNELARGLLAGPSRTALAVLPLGTSNLLGRHPGIPPRAPRAAAAGLGDGRAVRIDTATANGLPWIACAGVGIDAHIVAELTRARRGHIGFRSYAGPIWSALRDYAAPELVVCADGQEPVAGHLALVLNARPYAAFLTPAPRASLVDGLLDVVVLRGGGVRRFARWGWRAWRGALERDRDVRFLRAASLRIESAARAPFQIDGDVGAATPVDMLVLPRSLRVALPRRAAGLEATFRSTP